ncbi:MAG: metal-sensitive transcriptional regulator [Proteobacteria bacterium]|nr:metal-sensitive transcriptional regulator [Pseudomonadota bacterium]
MGENQVKHQHPDSDAKKQVMVRLNRIEGQVRGLKKMVEDDVYCHDILNQFASVKAALNGARDLILQGHIRHCIAEEMEQDKWKATEELINIFKKISK